LNALPQELRSKRIYRIAGGYVVSAWLVLQVASVVVPSLDLPKWTMKALLGFLLVGLSVALFAGWRLDVRDARKGRLSGQFHLVVWPAIALFLFGGVILVLTVWLNAGKEERTPWGDANGAPPARSIAVLPFESLSENKSDTYFADGVQDEILNNLAKIAQLKVISRTSVMQYGADVKRDLRQVARTLGVANILEGAVRRNGNRVRVSTELIDARDDNTIWADSYDRDLTDIFAIQSEIAQTIARKLTATLSPDEKNRIEAKPTDNLAAYDLYLRANEIQLGFAGSGILGNVEKPLSEAITLLEEAVRLDPNFTLAYCASAKAHSQIYHFADRTPKRRILADTAISSALRLQPDLPEVHLAYGYNLYWVYRDYSRAMVQLAVARRGLPNDASVTLLAAYMDRRQGHWEKAIQEFNEAIAHDPRNPESISELGDTLYFTRQFRAAEQVYDRLIELVPDQPMLKVQRADNVARKNGNIAPVRFALAAIPASMANDTGVLSWRLRFALYDRDWQRAKEIIDQMNGDEDDGNFVGGNMPVPVGCYSILVARLQGEQSGANASFSQTREQLSQRVQQAPGNALLLGKLGVVDALLNDKEAAISEAKRAVEMLPISNDAVDGPSMVYNLAVVYAWTDELDLAFEALGPLTKVPNGLYYGDLKFGQELFPIRKDPRFERLLAELAPRD
jgi:TolB-like protein/Tfp pilus assembly protein PilF